VGKIASETHVTTLFRVVILLDFDWSWEYFIWTPKYL